MIASSIPEILFVHRKTISVNLFLYQKNFNISSNIHRQMSAKNKISIKCKIEVVSQREIRLFEETLLLEICRHNRDLETI